MLRISIRFVDIYFNQETKIKLDRVNKLYGPTTFYIADYKTGKISGYAKLHRNTEWERPYSTSTKLSIKS